MIFFRIYFNPDQHKLNNVIFFKKRSYLCFSFYKFINVVKSEQMSEVNPAMNLLIQVLKKFFEQSEVPISYKTNKY